VMNVYAVRYTRERHDRSDIADTSATVERIALARAETPGAASQRRPALRKKGWTTRHEARNRKAGGPPGSAFGSAEPSASA
jgi:hypothetical protein